MAWAHARNGDDEQCLHALDAADRAFDRAPGCEVPEWAYWLDRTELDVMAGRCLTLLDRPGRAEAACAQTMAVLDALEAVGSARLVDRVAVLRRTLRRYADVPAVRDVEERVGTPR